VLLSSLVHSTAAVAVHTGTAGSAL
jgi:hypothetical protein